MSRNSSKGIPSLPPTTYTGIPGYTFRNACMLFSAICDPLLTSMPHTPFTQYIEYFYSLHRVKKLPHFVGNKITDKA